mmetsp:Transcript_9950/g.31601  ORF Transcript_9950/g.31601 Transcript_9950/m.31601 type:complete len:204 (-) Transcript_9950:1144-1755(-)
MRSTKMECSAESSATKTRPGSPTTAPPATSRRAATQATTPWELTAAWGQLHHAAAETASRAPRSHSGPSAWEALKPPDAAPAARRASRVCAAPRLGTGSTIVSWAPARRRPTPGTPSCALPGRRPWPPASQPPSAPRPAARRAPRSRAQTWAPARPAPPSRRWQRASSTPRPGRRGAPPQTSGSCAAYPAGPSSPAHPMPRPC